MNGEQRRNCEELLRFLEEDAAEEQCNMTFWVVRSDARLVPPMPERGQPECGTAACLAGWAALRLAPTIDLGPVLCDLDPYPVYKHQNRSVVRHIGRLAIDSDWLKEHDAEDLSSRMTSPRHYGLYNEYTFVDMQKLGLFLLGGEFEDTFGDTDGPAMCGLSHRDWMIAAIRERLGMSYNARYLPLGSSEYIDREFEDNDGPDD